MFTAAPTVEQDSPVGGEGGGHTLFVLENSGLAGEMEYFHAAVSPVKATILQ